MNKHKSNKIKENSNTVRHLNNGTDHRHSKSCCDQSSPARRTIIAHNHACYNRNKPQPWVHANKTKKKTQENHNPFLWQCLQIARADLEGGHRAPPRPPKIFPKMIFYYNIV